MTSAIGSEPVEARAVKKAGPAVGLPH